jgi:NodT family efflux transporter outer membrane factor (OMF) lipoprotein
MRFATSERRRALAALLSLSCAGCAVGPDFQRPTPPDVSSYLTQAEGDAELSQRVALGEKIPAQWWALFHSPRLDETLRQVLAANETLIAARAALAQAQQAIAQARGALFPQLDLVATARATTGPAPNAFSVGPAVSYSLDAFGGTRRRVEQQEALAEVQRYELAAAYLTLTGGSVVDAIAIASVRLQIATVEDLIANDEKNLDLVQREFAAGKVAKSDVLTASAQLASDRTQLPGLRQQLSMARHALAVLASRAPGRWTPPDFDMSELTLPAKPPISLPSDLVRQRPDILAAESLLHAQSAAIGVATADLYPSITLSVSFTRDATAVGDLFGSGASDTLGGGGTIDAPLFHGGSLVAQREAAVDAYRAQLATWRQVVFQAFGQVADALSALSHDADAVATSESAVDIAGTSLGLQRISLAAGKTSVLQLITAENTYSSARLALARAQGQQLTDTAQLFIAVGGGWWNGADLGAGEK